MVGPDEQDVDLPNRAVGVKTASYQIGHLWGIDGTYALPPVNIGTPGMARNLCFSTG